MRHSLRIGFLLMSVVGLLSCGKDNSSGIPYVTVNFSTSLSDPRISKVNSIGGSATVNGYGVAGLVLYHNTDGSIVAYDRCSSYLPQNKCAVTIDDTGFTVTDPCSGSKFSLADGTPVKAPASKSLRSYNVNVVGNNISITN